MSDFSRGFQHGFMHTLFNRMYGGYGFCGGFNFFCGCNTPTFTTPILNFNNMNRYFTPMANINFPRFNFTPQNFSAMNFNFNLPLFTQTNFTPYNYNTLKFSPATNNFSWNNTQKTSFSTNVDTFVKTSDNKQNNISYSATSSNIKKNIEYNAQKVSNKDITKYDSLIEKYAKKHSVDPNLIKAIIKQESRFNPNAESSAGAVGLMQLMPDTAKEVGVTDRTNPEQNIEGGIKYIKKMLNAKNGNLELALAAYNAGPGNVKNKIPQNKETPKFVANVLKYYEEYSGKKV